jgi:hypothetical protein
MPSGPGSLRKGPISCVGTVTTHAWDKCLKPLPQPLSGSVSSSTEWAWHIDIAHKIAESKR